MNKLINESFKTPVKCQFLLWIVLFSKNLLPLNRLMVFIFDNFISLFPLVLIRVTQRKRNKRTYIFMAPFIHTYTHTHTHLHTYTPTHNDSGFEGLASPKSVGQANRLRIQVTADVAILSLKPRNSGRISMLPSGGRIPSLGNFSLCS